MLERGFIATSMNRSGKPRSIASGVGRASVASREFGTDSGSRM